MTKPKLPLDGIRVLDLTRAYAGTTATLYLADLGAEVIKVEAAGRPDIPTRQINFAENDPGDVPWERAAYFHRLNNGKLDITLDLTKPAGIDLFKRLVVECDVVAENYLPTTMEKFGLQYDVLREINPKLIMVSMSGFGATKPRRHWASYYPGMEAMSGMTSISGYEDGQLMNSHTGYGDWLLGSAGTAALLIALHHRNRTGQGQYIDVSGCEAALVHLGEAVIDHALNGRAWKPQGNRHSSMAPHDTYRCADEDTWVAIAVRDEEDWQAFCSVLGDPEWSTEARFENPVSRHEHQDELRPLIQAWSETLDHHEAARQLLVAGVPAAPVLNPKEILFDPQLRHRGYFEVIEHPVVGRRIYPRQITAICSRMPRDPRTPAPLLGQDNRAVLGSLLGLKDAELEALSEEGIIGEVPTRKARPPSPHPFDRWQERGGKIDDDYRDALSAAYGVEIGGRSGAD
jgi:crotonobetainyl-CoA:carnitine CoA-transferase CaiB-like acyl-CoA transferase